MGASRRGGGGQQQEGEAHHRISVSHHADAVHIPEEMLLQAWLKYGVC